MALNEDTNFPPFGGPPFKINREWCIGDSLTLLNSNAENFDSRLINLNTIATALTAEVINLRDQLTGRLNQSQSQLGQIVSTTLFVPVNSTTQSNANVQILNYSTTVARSRNAWSSPIQTVGIPDVPVNAVAILAECYFNVNTYANHAVYWHLRKNSSEAWVEKMYMDPTGGSGAAFEAEMTTTIPIYFDLGPKTFQVYLSSPRGSLPSSNPYYGLRIRLLGYYVKIA